MKSFLAAHPGVQVSHVTDIGLREYMEDRLDVRVIGSDGLLMTICDGHGGSACANFVIKRYPLVVAERLSAKQKKRPLTIMKEALKQVSDDWDHLSFNGSPAPKTSEARQKFFEGRRKSKRNTSLMSGTTLLSCYLETSRRQCHVLNLGDSRAAWQLGHTVSSTRDHKPNQEDVSAIRGFNTWVEMDEDVPRLNGDLSVGRSIGDNTPVLSGCILREPYTYVVKYPHHTLKLILASDGLWDEVGDIQQLFTSTSAEAFIKDHTTSDNLSVIYLVHSR